jgi:hypothetical protein
VTGPPAGQVQFSTGNASFMGRYENWGGIEPNNGASLSYAYMNLGTGAFGIANGEMGRRHQRRLQRLRRPRLRLLRRVRGRDGRRRPGAHDLGPDADRRLRAAAVLRRRRMAAA